jgi:hypothetical protein
VLFQNGPSRVLWVNPESIHIDVQVAGEFASCCGVNLTFAALGGVWVLSASCEKLCSYMLLGQECVGDSGLGLGLSSILCDAAGGGSRQGWQWR